MYEIEFSNAASKELGDIYEVEKKLYLRLITVIETLKMNPYQGKKLKGIFKGDYSLRVGDHRVIYTVYKNRLIVYIIDIGHRREIYR